MSTIITKKLRIEGMHCSSCAMSINWALEDLPGVEEASTSYAKGYAEVSFDPGQVSEADVLAAIHEAGFQASGA